jgi:hypothetical protein
MTFFVKRILKARIPLTFYYGDSDSVCNYILGQKFVDKLGLKVIFF